jgi:hypothetical protein
MKYNIIKLTTQISKNQDNNEVLDFRVQCIASSTEHENPPEREIGYLYGFLYEPDYVPGSDGYDSDFDIFDSRSSNAMHAFELLVNERPKILNALSDYDAFEYYSGILLCEKGYVEKPYRGMKLAHRMFREIKHIFKNGGSFMMMKAHPDGPNITEDDCRHLADYYMSDVFVALKEIDRDNLSGWLIADIGLNEIPSGDESIIYIKARM